MNYTMMSDLYEFTMSQVYFNEGKQNEIAYFDSFFRKNPFEGGYAVMGGCDELINYIKNLKFTEEDIKYLRSTNLFNEPFLNYLKHFKFTGDIYAIPDGTVIFGNEPIVTVKAPIIEAQIIETALLYYLNSNIKYTTAAVRMTNAAGDIPIMEFGARRGDNPVRSSKCSFIGGCVGTSNIIVGKQFGISTMGTMAHSQVCEADSEYDAFLSYAKTYPDNAIFLIDTYDTLNSGLLNAIAVAKDYLIPNGYTLKGVRIDSGDLAYLTKETRRILDENGLTNTKICVSNGLTPLTIESLKMQGACIDSIGAGDNIAAPKERVGAVYKLVAIENKKEIIPKIKVSEDSIKTINPGYKRLYRLYCNKTKKALCDIIGLYDESIEKANLIGIDISNGYNVKQFHDYEIRELQVPIFSNGILVYDDPTIFEKREYCKKELLSIDDEIKRLINPEKYYINGTQNFLNLKNDLILEHSRKKNKMKSIGSFYDK